MTSYKLEDYYAIMSNKVVTGFWDHKMPILDKSEEEIIANIIKWAKKRDMINNIRENFSKTEIKKWFLYSDEMESDLHFKLAEVLTKFRDFKKSIAYTEGSGSIVNPAIYRSKGKSNAKKHARNDSVNKKNPLSQRNQKKTVEEHGYAPIWIEQIYSVTRKRIEWIKDPSRKKLFTHMLENFEKEHRDFPYSFDGSKETGDEKVTYVITKEVYDEFKRLLHQTRDDLGIHESFTFPFNPAVFYNFGELFGYFSASFGTRYTERLQFSTRKVRVDYDETSIETPVGNNEGDSARLIDFVSPSETIWGENMDYTSDRRMDLKDMFINCGNHVMEEFGESGYDIYSRFIECGGVQKELLRDLEDRHQSENISRKFDQKSVTKVVVFVKRYLQRELQKGGSNEAA